MRPNDSSARPSASTSRGPTTATSGSPVELVEQTIDRAGGDDRVAVQQEQVARRWLARMPMLLARAKPRLAPASITRTPGQRRAASALPSVEPLSDDDDLVIGATAAPRCSDSRQRSRSARALNETMMIESTS